MAIHRHVKDRAFTALAFNTDLEIVLAISRLSKQTINNHIQDIYDQAVEAEVEPFTFLDYERKRYGR